MKLIMENWRKYLINESEKGMEASELAEYDRFARFNSIFKEYAAEHGLAVLKIENIFINSFQNQPRDKTVELVNQFLMEPPASFSHQSRSARNMAGKISFWGAETYPDAEDKRILTDTVENDIIKFWNSHTRQSGEFPQFYPGRDANYYYFLLDSGGEPFDLVFKDSDQSAGFSKSYVKITPPAAGEEVIVSLVSDTEVVPLPSTLAGGSGSVARGENEASLKGKIKVSNTSPEFGQPV